MRAFQQFAGWLAPQDVGRTRRDKLVGRVGLATLELLDIERAAIPGDIRLDPPGERDFVKAKALAHIGRSGVDRPFGAAQCAIFQSRLIFLARLHLCTSVGPS